LLKPPAAKEIGTQLIKACSEKGTFVVDSKIAKIVNGVDRMTKDN